MMFLSVERGLGEWFREEKGKGTSEFGLLKKEIKNIHKKQNKN
jgi:hypothetical protein